jgi:hypothetical protein
MNQVSADREPASVRAAFRRAGEATADARAWLVCGGLVSLVALAGVTVLLLGAGQLAGVSVGPLLLALGFVGTVVIPAGLVGITLGFPLAAAYRARQRQRLRRQLAGLSLADRAALLSPLLRDPAEDTRKLVAPLLRELRAASELVPSTYPTGRGSEAMPSLIHDALPVPASEPRTEQ